MAYNGFEIAMLSLGGADSLLITRWANSVPTRVLLDGGKKGHAPKIKAFLAARGATRIDHVVCTHHDGDHAGGLVELIKDEGLQFGKAWAHVPGRHVDRSEVEAALSRSVGSRKAQVVEGSLRTSDALLSAIRGRGVALEEPFRGARIGFLTVCGPSKKFYEQLVGSFRDADKIRAYDLSESRSEALARRASNDGLHPSPPAHPENDSSVILATRYEEGTYLFTGDAGPRALERAKDSFALANCRWMQIPHHGSRSNVTADLVEHFAPETAYVSAPGTDDHPHQAVVGAFKRAGSHVYSTHYPGGSNLYHRIGTLPDLPEPAIAATPL